MFLSFYHFKKTVHEKFIGKDFCILWLFAVIFAFLNAQACLFEMIKIILFYFLLIDLQILFTFYFTFIFENQIKC